ncbi:MAG: hypothetical protein WCJ54_08880 [Actinomycetota bacterium]
MEKITFFNVYKFELPLKKELVVKKHRLNKREGLLISIGISNGLCGFGEISPLPFFHNESIDDARLQIKNLKNNKMFLKNIEGLFEQQDLSDFFSDSIKAVKKDSEDVTYYRAQYGSNVAILEKTRDQLSQEKISTETFRSTIEDANLIETASKMQYQEFALQATLQSSTKIIKNSLLNFMQ